MSGTTDFLVNIRRMIKLHECMLKEICTEYGLTLTEASVISFLHNNPGKDTAADIVELRMLQKSNVSQAAEMLFQKGLLARTQDERDRRKVHLTLTGRAEPIVRQVDRISELYHRKIFSGLTGEEMENFIRVNEKIGSNILRAMGGGDIR